MILSDKLILEAIERGDIHISPFTRERLGSNSYDITLHPTIKWYSREAPLEIIDARGKTMPLICDYLIDVKTDNPTTEYTIDEKEGIILLPGTIYIARTNEYTSTQNLVPKIDGKSSIGRLGIFIHATAGFGDIGFEGTWTLEIMVVQPVRIYPNMLIGQLSWETTGECINPYNKKVDAKYNGQIEATASRMHENFK